MQTTKTVQRSGAVWWSGGKRRNGKTVIQLAQTDNYERHSGTNVYRMNSTSMFHVSMQFIFTEKLPITRIITFYVWAARQPMSRLCPIVIHALQMCACVWPPMYIHRVVQIANRKMMFRNGSTQHTHTLLRSKCVELGEKGICAVTLRFSREYFVCYGGK